MTDEQMEKLAVKHESFGFGQVDAKGLTVHGFDPDGLSAFVTELIASRGAEIATLKAELRAVSVALDDPRTDLTMTIVEVITDLRGDAERYRWLCEQNEKGNGYFHITIGARGLSGWRNKHELDDLFDSARS
jgi:hypothetical protein